MNWADRPREGFTLMEATVALAVLTVGMLGLAGTFSQIVHVNTASRHKQVAVLLAERKLTQLRMATAAEWTNTNGRFEAPFDDYAWEVRQSVQSRDLNLVDAWVEVTHRSGAGVRLWSQTGGADAR